MPKSLTALFSPRSLAVVGASRSPEKVGAVVLQNILNSNFTGKIYAVNPNEKEINGIKCFPNVSDLPEVVDLAIIAIPSTVVLQVLNQIGEKGIKNVVVFSAGFKEAGAEGASLEKQLEETAQKYGINLLGPNCLGFVNNVCPLNATFGKVSAQIGNLRFISQSGAIAASLFDWFGSIGLGFSEFITLGNKTVVNENDVLEYFFNQSQSITSLIEEGPVKVQPIGLYLESITDGAKFVQIAKQITQKDPVFILKPGKTPEAASAMKSHTGSLAGADDVLDTALEQAGIFRCETLEDFFDLSKAFSWENIPNGPKVAIVSNAGGPAVISTDSIVKEGLTVAKFDDETKNKLSQILPRSANIFNPIDVLGDALADRFAGAMEIVFQTNECDSLLVILTPQIMTQIKKTAEAISVVSNKYHKPIFCSFMGGSLVAEGLQILNKCKIPCFPFPERAIYAIGSMWKFKQQQIKLSQSPLDINQVLNTQLLPEKIVNVVQSAIKNGQMALDNLDANQVVAGAGIPTPLTKVAKDLSEAISFSTEAGYPVVLKMSSPGLLHKKSVGGVILDIRNEDQLESAWDTIQRKIEGLDETIKNNVCVQIQKEIPNGIEVIVGVKHDPTFGHVLLFGAGGSLTELIADKNLYLLPVDKEHAKQLVQSSKIAQFLNGYNGEPPYALDKLYELIVHLSKIVEVQPEIKEIEINPVVVTLNDVWAVDSKIILEAGRQKPVGPKFKIACTTSSKLLAGNTRYFEFETEEEFKAEAGQYISVKVSSSRINCYSIAGQPTQNKFNLLVDSTPGGPGSKFFEQLKVGDKITYLGPFGTFTIKPDKNVDNLLFLATGSGAAPLKHMIESELAKKTKLSLSLYIGVNNFEDIFLKDYFQKLLDEHNNFKFKYAVRNPNSSWNGHVGFITDLVAQDFPNAKKCAAYLCGSKPMIDSVTKALTDNGCPAERICTEKL